MTDGQIAAIRKQFARVMEEDSDRDILRLWKSANGELEKALTVEEFGRIEDRVKEMGRRNTARQLRIWGPDFKRAAEAMEVDLGKADGDRANGVARALAILVKSGEVHGWMQDALRRQYRRASELAYPVQEAQVLGFLAPLLEMVSALMKESLRETHLRRMEATLEGTRPAERWPGWAKACLERMLVNEHPKLFEHLDGFADEVLAAMDDRKAATVYIDGMRAQARRLIDERRKALIREKAKKLADRRARQLARSRSGPQGMAGSDSKNHGSGKLGKRAQGDPNYKGPGKRSGKNRGR